MKVLLVNPACLDRRVTDNDGAVMPIGLYYLAAQLLDQGVPTLLLNLAALPGETDQGPAFGKDAGLDTFEAVITRERPDLIGFSVTNPSRFSAMACAEKARQILPRATIVFGGPCPTFMAPHLFHACPALDLAVRGEGEKTLVRLVQALASASPDLGAIKGLVFRQGAGLVDTGLPDLVENLDSLARPSRYFTFAHLAMSRGCPGRCTFCGSPKFWGSGAVRRHSVDWFFAEIKTLYQKGVSHFYLSDDTFTQDREAVLRLCQRIMDDSLPITWNAISRVDAVDQPLLSAMRQAGCIQISFGIESGAPAIQRVLGKPMDDKIAIQAFEAARRCGILPRAYFIYGSPGETHETIEQSVALMEKLNPLSAVFYMLVLFPGTHLYARALKKGLVTDAVWFNPVEDLPWFELDPQLSFEQVRDFGERLRQAFFANLPRAALSLSLDPDLSLFHADFLSRLALTFSHGEYAKDPRIKDPAGLARSLFEKALTFGKEPRAYLGLSMLHQKERRFSQAQSLLEQGLAAFPDHKDLSVGMGVCLMNQGQFQRALDFFTPFEREPGLGQYMEICRSRSTL